MFLCNYFTKSIKENKKIINPPKYQSFILEKNFETNECYLFRKYYER